MLLSSILSSVVRSILCAFPPGGSSPPDTRRRCCHRLPSPSSGCRCQPDESLSHGFIDGQSRLRRRLKCQVDSQTDGRVAVDLDFSRCRRSFWSCKSGSPAGSNRSGRSSCGIQVGAAVAVGPFLRLLKMKKREVPFLHHTGAKGQVALTSLYHVTIPSAGRLLLIGCC